MNVPRPTIKASKAVLAVTLAASLCPAVPAIASESAPQPASGAQPLANDQPANADWKSWDGCEWSVTNGHLTIRPVDAESVFGIPSGYLLPDSGSPWRFSGETITSVTFESGVVAIDKRCAGMFAGMQSLESVDLSGLDTSHATDMNRMFYGCSALKNLNLGTFDLSSATSLDRMFYGCSSLPSIDLSGRKTPNLTRMDAMFTGCSALQSANLSGLDTSNVTDMTWLFDKCSSLTEIDLSSLDFSNVNSLSDLFANCTSLTSVKLPETKMPKNRRTDFMFGNCTSLRTVDVANLDMSNVSTIGGMFANCTSLESIDVSKWDTSNVTSTFSQYSFYSAGPGFMAGIFAGCSSLKAIDLSNWDLSNAEQLDYCFAGCKSLESVKLPSKAMEKCTSLTGLFLDCSSLKTADLSALKAPQATNINTMFAECEALSSVNIPSGCLPSATKVGGMFYNCKSLTNLDLTGLGSQTINSLDGYYDATYNYAIHPPVGFEGVGNIGVLVGVFEGCTSLRSLTLPDWDTSQVKDADAAALMFNGCDSLEEIAVGARFAANAFPQVGANVANATGMWVIPGKNAVFTPGAVPANTAATYVAQLQLSAGDFTVDTSQETFAGKPVTKHISTDLVEGRDYQVSYENNTQPGKATLIISGMGRYCNVLRYEFDIVEQTGPTPPGPEAPASIDRLAGYDAAETSAQIAQAGFASGSDWVVIARDDDFADAMSATGLAGALNAPILLTDRYGLSDATAQAVRALGATKAYVIGGTGAIPGDLEGQLAAAGCQQIERVWGEESWDTSVACADKIAEHNGNPTGSAIVAMSSNFQDALSISSFAYLYQAPIYLETSGDTRELPDEARKAVEGLSGTIYVPGGTGAVPADSVEGVFGEERVQRIWGEDGYDTSNQIATYMVEHGLLSATTVCVASGAPAPKGVDALAGAALAGRAGGVMLLANDNAEFGEVNSTAIDAGDSKGTPAFLKSHAADVRQAHLLGGNAVVGTDLQQKVEGLLK